MSTIYRREVTITSRDCGTHNQCRPSSVLGILQDSATIAAVELGVDHDTTTSQYQAVWMVARLWYQLSVPLYCGDTITIETWHRGGKGPFLYRDFDIYRNGILVGEGLALWILYGLETKSVLPVAILGGLEENHGGERCKERTLKKLKAPKELTKKWPRIFRYSDLDINGHVNNVKYVDVLCDAAELETLESHEFVSSVQIDYYAQCFPKEEVFLQVGNGEGGTYILGTDQEGTHRFGGLVTTKTFP